MEAKAKQAELDLPSGGGPGFSLTVTLDYAGGFIQLDWRRPETNNQEATLRVRCSGLNELTWELTAGTQSERELSSLHRSAIRARLARLSKRFVLAEEAFTARARRHIERGKLTVEPLDLPPEFARWQWLESQIVFMARDLRLHFSPLGRILQEIEQQDPLMRL